MTGEWDGAAARRDAEWREKRRDRARRAAELNDRLERREGVMRTVVVLCIAAMVVAWIAVVVRGNLGR